MIPTVVVVVAWAAINNLKLPEPSTIPEPTPRSPVFPQEPQLPELVEIL